MIALMKRILSVSGPYQGRIKLAFVFAFLKAMLSKAPIGLSFLALSAFLQGTMTARLCLWLAVGTVGCVLLECLCQNIADRLQAAAGYMVFADLRMELGRHLRRLPWAISQRATSAKSVPFCPPTWCLLRRTVCTTLPT